MASGMKWRQSMHSLRGGLGGGRHVSAHARSAAVTHHCCVESWHLAIGKGPPLAGRAAPSGHVALNLTHRLGTVRGHTHRNGAGLFGVGNVPDKLD